MKFPFLHLSTPEALKWRAYYEAEGSATYSEPRGAESTYAFDHNVIMQHGEPIIWINLATEEE